MGSNQSYSNDTDRSFSIDPNGNITHGSSTTNNNYSSANIKSTDHQAETSPTSSISQLSNNPQPSIVDSTLNTASIAKTEPPQVLGSTNSGNENDYLNLKEADEIATKMKSKYRPELAGKQQSAFSEAERKIVQCYINNKNQTMNCSKVVEEYRNYVVNERDNLLRRSLHSNIPLVTTLFVLFTCLLLHISTVSCYGAMSIDLGSEWMKVGLVAPSVQMDIVLNAQSQRKTPMAVAFSNGERFIGDPALDVASKYPERTFTHFLDLVGKQSVNDESVRHYVSRFPFANITNPEPALAIIPSLDNSSTPLNEITLNHPEGFQFTPLELVAMMIQLAHDQVASALINNEPATDVVITVPPFFTATERRVIEDAARIVGLNVLRLTSVNSAFALSYGIFRHKDYLPKTSENRTSILFFDQGASHTSATLADYHLVEQVDEATGVSKNESLPTVTIRAQVYDRFLGGFDMQIKLRDHLVKSFAKENKIEENRILNRGRSASKLLKESGRVKKILSANTGHTVRVENVIDDKDMKQPITRQEFEDLNEEYLGARIIKLLDRLFEMDNVNRDEKLESVIIVGGNTRTPKLQQTLIDYFKLETLGKSINADEGAALAALYQAASLGRGFRVKKFILEEFNETVSDQSATVPLQVSPEQLVMSQMKLIKLQEQDNLRLQRLSLRNALESILSEAREKVQEVGEGLVAETQLWLEEGPYDETQNVTILAEKLSTIHELIHPKPTTIAPSPTPLSASPNSPSSTISPDSSEIPIVPSTSESSSTTTEPSPSSLPPPTSPVPAHTDL